MRLCLLIPGSLDAVSGGCLYDRHLVASLRRRGHRVDVVSLPFRSYPASLLRNLDPRLSRRLARGEYDLLLQDELAHPGLFAANSRIARGIRCPVVSVVHHLLCREPDQPAMLAPLLRGVETHYLQSVHALILASRHAAECVRDLVPGLPDHVLAPPGADHAGPAVEPRIIASRSRDPAPLRLLFVGRVSPRKGLLWALRSLARVTDIPWQLHVAGDTRGHPRSVRRVRRFLQERGLRERVRFHGGIPDERLHRLYRESHILFMPFAYEGYGIVFLEAMAAGLPVLARQGCGTTEIVRHGENGFLLAPGDLDGAATRIRELAGNRERLLTMGLAAREAFLRHPSWEQSMARVEGFLAELCRKNGSA